jgi:hypothetical protein
MHGKSMTEFVTCMACLYTEDADILVYKSVELNYTDICYCMKFYILTALIIKIMVFWDVNLCD